MTVLAFDLGTSYLKGALVDAEGQLLAVRRDPPPVHRHGQGRWEMDPAVFLDRIKLIAARLAAQRPEKLEDVSAITFATQANTFTLLDSASRPLMPFIGWPDRRARSLDPGAFERLQEAVRPEQTGIPRLSHEFALVKLRWMRDCDPALLKRARRLCLLGDWLALWLSGRHVTEAGVAGLTAALDIHSLEWVDTVCAAAQIERDWLAPVQRAGVDLGPVAPAAAAELGVRRDCRVHLGLLDQYAAAIGVGNICPGSVSETTGTVLAVVRCTQQPQAAGGIFLGPSPWSGRYFQMSFSNTSASLLEAFRNTLPDWPEFSELDRLAASVSPGADGLRLRAGADAACWPDVFDHLSSSHTRGHIARAIMEGVALQLCQDLQRLCGEDRAHWPRCITAAGGGARSQLWLQIKSELTGVQVVAADVSEPPAAGAATLTASPTRPSIGSTTATFTL